MAYHYSNIPTGGANIMALTELEVKKAKATDKAQKLSDGFSRRKLKIGPI
jgi:hypothetical protein